MGESKQILSKEEIIELLKEVAVKEDVVNPVYEINSICEEEHNGLSYMSGVVIKGDNDVRIPVVIKSAPRMKKHRKKLPVRLFFLQEIRFYEEVFPALINFQNTRSVSNPFQSIPKFYKANSEECKELLVIENIEETGFVELDDALEQDDEHVKLILKECGKFHAVSLAMKDQDSEGFRKLTADIFYPFSTMYMSDAMKKTFVKKSDWITSVFDKDTEREVYRAVVSFHKGIWGLLKSLDVFQGEYAVITHGSSAYFKCQETSPPTELRFTDLERWTVTTPITEIAYPFYVSAKQERLDNLDEYLKLYHDSMREHLTQMGSDAERCFPFSALKQEWKKYAKVGLLMTVLMLTHECSGMTKSSSSESSSESSSSISTDSDSDSELLELKKKLKAQLELERALKHERFRRIVLHFYENDFLKD